MSDFDNQQPVHITTGSVQDGERVHLFSIDDKQFTIPDKPRVNIAIKYLWNLKATKNSEMAMAQLLEDMLTPAGFEALAHCEDVTEDQLKQVMDIAKDNAFAGLEGALGN